MVCVSVQNYASTAFVDRKDHDETILFKVLKFFLHLLPAFFLVSHDYENRQGRTGMYNVCASPQWVTQMRA